MTFYQPTHTSNHKCTTLKKTFMNCLETTFGKISNVHNNKCKVHLDIPLQ